MNHKEPLENVPFFLDCMYIQLVDNNVCNSRVANILQAYHELINNHSCPVRYHGDIVACYTEIIATPELPNTIAIGIRQNGIEMATDLGRFNTKSSVFGDSVEWYCLEFNEYCDHSYHYCEEKYNKQNASFQLTTEEETRNYFSE